MRSIALILAAIVVLVAGGIQTAATALYGDLARPPAIPALVPPRLGIALATAIHAQTGPPAVRAAYARALVHRGDFVAAERIVAGLPAGIDVADVRGQIAQARGDIRTAVERYIDAGDDERAQAIVDTIDRRGDRAAAIALQRRLIDRLTAGSGHSEVLAVALWRLGQMEQELAFAQPAGAAPHRRASLALYDRALALAPNDETFLLAAGTQALVLGDPARAQRYFQRALDVVPTSADARAGLERARAAMHT